MKGLSRYSGKSVTSSRVVIAMLFVLPAQNLRDVRQTVVVLRIPLGEGEDF
ncbi:hypothetical protein GGI1_24746, partial [Acidithiobacillus sp. GGI-221]